METYEPNAEEGEEPVDEDIKALWMKDAEISPELEAAF